MGFSRALRLSLFASARSISHLEVKRSCMRKTTDLKYVYSPHFSLMSTPWNFWATTIEYQVDRRATIAEISSLALLELRRFVDF